jgi:hypothetical protein
MPQHPSIGPISNFLMGRPIAAPADAVRTNNPNAPVTPGRQMTGVPGAVTRGIVAPVMNHPLTTALAGIAAPAALGAGAAAAGSAGAAAPGIVEDLGPLSDLGRGIGHASPEWQSKAIHSLLQTLTP